MCAFREAQTVQSSRTSRRGNERQLNWDGSKRMMAREVGEKRMRGQSAMQLLSRITYEASQWGLVLQTVSERQRSDEGIFL